MSEYVTEAALKHALTLTGTTFADYDIPVAVASANAAVNEACGRVFDRDISSATTRYYRPQSADLVLVDDLASSSGLVLETSQFGENVFDRTWTLHTEFELEPLNAIADDWPYTRIVRNPWRGSLVFPVWSTRSVKVTGKFGWPGDVPSQIVTAATLLATRLVKRVREAPFGVIPVQLDVGSAVRIARTDPDVRGLLEPFTREKI